MTDPADPKPRAGLAECSPEDLPHPQATKCRPKSTQRRCVIEGNDR